MQPGAGPSAPTMDISPESLRVLVVESNASARGAIVQLLKECSYQVRRCDLWVFGRGPCPRPEQSGGC